MIEVNLVIDASNKTCPLPVLYAKKALQTLSVNDTLLIICTDLKAEDDLKKFCKKKGHLYLSSEIKDDKLFIFLQKC
jgi:tRNA 2-thiouridine synthesizing protein A